MHFLRVLERLGEFAAHAIFVSFAAYILLTMGCWF